MWSIIIKGPHVSPAAAQNVLPLVLLLHGEDARPAGHLLHHHQHRAAAPDAALVNVQLFLWTFVHFWKLCLVLCHRQTFHSLRFSVKETLLCWCTLLCPFLGKVHTKTFTAQLTPKELSFMHHSKQIPWDDHLTACHLCITQIKFYEMNIWPQLLWDCRDGSWPGRVWHRRARSSTWCNFRNYSKHLSFTTLRHKKKYKMRTISTYSYLLPDLSRIFQILGAAALPNQSTYTNPPHFLTMIQK